MRTALRYTSIRRCVVCGAEEAVIGKGGDWTGIGGGLFVCSKKVCMEEFRKHPMVGRPVPPSFEPTEH